jgi:tetrahydromethanopterin S-methyltransferase subunit A
MQVQVNTDRNITGDAAAIDLVEAMVRDALDRFSAKITRVEVHLSDQNSNKKGGSDDLRCAMEARVAGLQPIAVTHSAASMEEAANGAAGKLKRSLESTFGRLDQR